MNLRGLERSGPSGSCSPGSASVDGASLLRFAGMLLLDEHAHLVARLGHRRAQRCGGGPDLAQRLLLLAQVLAQVHHVSLELDERGCMRGDRDQERTEGAHIMGEQPDAAIACFDLGLEVVARDRQRHRAIIVLHVRRLYRHSAWLSTQLRPPEADAGSRAVGLRRPATARGEHALHFVADLRMPAARSRPPSPRGRGAASWRRPRPRAPARRRSHGARARR